MKNRLPFVVNILGIILLMALYLNSPAHNDALHRRDLIQMFGGKDGIEILTHPTEVDAYLLVLSSPIDPPTTAKLVRYPTSSGPVKVPKPLMTKITAVLSSPLSYGWDYDTTCIGSLTSRLSFYYNEQRLDILIGGCQQILVIRNRKIVGGENLGDKEHQVLETIFKSLFTSKKSSP